MPSNPNPPGPSSQVLVGNARLRHLRNTLQRSRTALAAHMLKWDIFGDALAIFQEERDLLGPELALWRSIRPETSLNATATTDHQTAARNVELEIAGGIRRAQDKLADRSERVRLQSAAISARAKLATYCAKQNQAVPGVQQLLVESLYIKRHTATSLLDHLTKVITSLAARQAYVGSLAAETKAPNGQNTEYWAKRLGKWKEMQKVQGEAMAPLKALREDRMEQLRTYIAMIRSRHDYSKGPPVMPDQFQLPDVLDPPETYKLSTLRQQIATLDSHGLLLLRQPSAQQ